MDLAEFIAARLDDDEDALADDPSWGDAHGTCYECGTNVHRLRREVAAKRAILALHYRLPVHKNGPLDDSCICQDYGGAETGKWPCDTLRALAAVWSDHPDYRAEWKP